jgi:hypothetical protein|tara:strand:- start:427 stop:792 length:366 start_codon:yes stop_codon:yes gene_type:complete
MTQPTNDWRLPTPWESSIFARLMMGHFQGADEIREQLASASVRTLDDWCSFSIQTTSPAKAKEITRVPVEAHGSDTDGHLIHYLLHVGDGFVHELEVYTDTIEDPHRHPDVDELTVEVNND